MKAELKYVKVGDIQEHPDNPRVIEDHQFEKLKESIKANKDYFEARPIIVNQDDVVVAGNQRLKAAIALGMKEVPVAKLKLTKKREREIMIRDNHNNGKWDFQQLAIQFEPDDLVDWGFAPDELGLTDPEGEEPDFDERTLEKSRKTFLSNMIKQVVLYFKDEEYNDFLERFDKIAKELKLENNTEVVKHLLKHYENTTSINKAVNKK